MYICAVVSSPWTKYFLLRNSECKSHAEHMASFEMLKTIFVKKRKKIRFKI